MGTASLHFDAWSLAWRDFLKKFAPACGRLDCRHTQSLWRRYRRKSRGVVIQGLRYCVEECMERALGDAVDCLGPVSETRSGSASHPARPSAALAPATHRRSAAGRARRPAHRRSRPNRGVAAGARLRERAAGHGCSGPAMVVPGAAGRFLAWGNFLKACFFESRFFEPSFFESGFPQSRIFEACIF